MTIDRDTYGIREKLTPDMLKKKNAMVVTVSRAQQVSVTRDGEERMAVVLEFAQFPRFAYWPNDTGVRVLVEQLGEEEDEWPGKKIPLVRARTTNPNTHKQQEVLWVAQSADWQDIFRAAGVRNGKKASKQATKQATKKRRRK